MSLAALSRAARDLRRALDRRGINHRARAAGGSSSLHLPPAVDDEKAVEEATMLLRATACVPVAASPVTVSLCDVPSVTVDVRPDDDGAVRLLAAGELLVVPLGYVGPHDIYQLGEVLRFGARAALGARDEPGAHSYGAVDAWREVYAAAHELLDADLTVEDMRAAADEARESPAARRFARAAAAYVRTLRAPDDSGPNVA